MKTKHHKPKKAAHHAKGKQKKGAKRKGHGKGLRGPGENPAKRSKTLVSGLAEAGKTLAGNALGLTGAALIAKGLDKVPFLAENPADSKVIMILKKAAKPVVIVGVGATTHHFAHKKDMKFVQSISNGLLLGGALSTFKAITKSTLFDGLGNAVNTDEIADKNAEYYRENAEMLRQVAEENKVALNLPGDEGEEGKGMDGLGEAPTIPGTQLVLDNNAMVL